MNKVMIVLAYRSGSRQFLDFLLSKTTRETVAVDGPIVPCIHRRRGTEDLNDLLQANAQSQTVCFWTRMDPAEHAATQAIAALDSSWKIVAMVRDGRNQVASIRTFRAKSNRTAHPNE